MEKKRIFLIKAGTIDHDYRMPKEIKVMKQGGYAVTLLSWDRDCKKSHLEQRGGGKYYEEIRVRLKAPIGIKLLLILPIWWFFEFFELMRTKWDIAHVIDFHSIIPGLIASKLKRKPVIYEILDSYEDMTAWPNILRYFFIQVDRIFMRLASAVIIVDEAQVEEFGGIPNSKVIPIYDSPPYLSKKLVVKENEVFTLFYAGRIYKARRLNLDKIVSAISSINNVKLIIAGYGDQVEEVEKWSHAMPNKIQFLGKISYDEALERSIAADLLFEVRDPLIPLHKYNCGSKFLRAMSCGKPILVNKETSAANKVYENNCGLVVDIDNIEEIKNAIIKLRDNPELCRELGANSRKAYEERYSWEIMERRLLALYQGLTGGVGDR
jgi:glycosyltransferase involved in cell wall biosynthesis